MSKRNKKIFLDTNIILDYLDHRSVKSIALIEKIKEKKNICYGSLFLLLELLDVEKDKAFFHKLVLERKATINEFLRERYNKNLHRSDFEALEEQLTKNIEAIKTFVYFYGLDGPGWGNALSISSQTNLFSQDVIHLSTAIMLKCNVFIRKDTKLIREGKQLLRNKDFLKNAGLKKNCVQFLNPEQAIKAI